MDLYIIIKKCKEMKNILKLFLLLFIFGGLVLSCDRTGDGDVSDDQGGTSTQEMAGDWFVTTSVGGTQVADYARITTYNTSANNGQEMWIDDNHNIWDFKVKTPINYEAKTFSGSGLHSSVDGYDVNVTITNGKIIKGGATTTGGNKSDAIEFDAEFSDDPGTIYRISGYKRTGFVEDEH